MSNETVDDHLMKRSADHFLIGENLINAALQEQEQYDKYFKTEHDKLVDKGNKKFGPNCWSHALTKHDIDCIDYIDGKYSVGAFAVVKVELKNGIYHEDIGYGSCFGLGNKIMSISNARQEAALNGLQKAIESFTTLFDSDDNEDDDDVKPDDENIECDWNKDTCILQKSVQRGADAAASVCVASNSVPHINQKLLHPVASLTEEIEQREHKYEKKKKHRQREDSCTSYSKYQVPVGILEEEPACISSQTLNEMIKSVNVHTKHSSGKNVQHGKTPFSGHSTKRLCTK